MDGFPICMACLGDCIDPATGQPCPRCDATGCDPDPAAPSGVLPLPAGTAA
jgi:hypothetical protein